MIRIRDALLAAKTAALADWMPRTVEVDGIRIARISIDVAGADTESPEPVAFVRLTPDGRAALGRGWNRA